MRKVIIREGENHSLQMPEFLYKQSRLVFDFILNENCAYDLKSAEQFEVNTLCGIGFGLRHKKNSYCLGWNYDVMSKRIQLSHNYFNNGTKESPYMCAVELNQQCRAYINFDRYANTIWTRISAVVDGKSKQLYSEGIFFDFAKVPNWGFLLNFSFGESKKAPHNMDVLMQQIA